MKKNNSIWKEPKTKSALWRLIRLRLGLCPHCGQPCAPYRECSTRRLDRRNSATRNRKTFIRLDRPITRFSQADLYNFIIHLLPEREPTPLEQLIAKEERAAEHRRWFVEDRLIEQYQRWSRESKPRKIIYA